MSATFIDRHFSRTHEIIGFRRERAAFDHAGLIMIGDYAPTSPCAYYHPDVMIDTVIAGSGMYQWPRQCMRCVTGTLIVARAGEVHDTRPDAGGMTIVSMVAPPPTGSARRRHRLCAIARHAATSARRCRSSDSYANCI